MKKLLAIIGLTLTSLTSAHAVEVDMDAAAKALQEPDTLLIDVRSPDEYATGAIEGAINIPHDHIGQNIETVTTDKDRTIVVYCRSGRRSDLASNALVNKGYANVINGGGYEELKDRLAR